MGSQDNQEEQDGAEVHNDSVAATRSILDGIVDFFNGRASIVISPNPRTGGPFAITFERHSRRS
jgi:hypothetical protein